MPTAFDPLERVLRGETADIYLARAQNILKLENLNPQVTMEVFTNGGGILCGMKETLALLSRVPPQWRSVGPPRGR